MITSVRWEIPEPLDVCEFATPDGASIFVRRHGNPDGPRIVLSHANGFSADAYYPYWSHFTRRFDVFIHDLRNHGWNPAGDLQVHNVAAMVNDSELVVQGIDRRFGNKPRAGIFHSLTSMVALRQAALGGGGYSALVLFDPTVCPSGGFPKDLQGVGSRMSAVASKRQNRFNSPEVFAESLFRSRVFERVHPDVINLFARTTLRRTADGTDYELCCPPAFEAQLAEYIFLWSMIVDFDSVACPIKVIGSDPTVPYTYMPSMDLGELVQVDYDFVPETSHLLQFEQPDTCAALTFEFLNAQGFS